MLLALQATAVVVTAVSWLPQWWRAFRSRTAGLSRSAWVQAAVLGGTWALWGVQAEVWSMALSEGAFALGCLAILATVLPRRRFVAWSLAAVVVAGAAAAWLPAVWLGVAGLVGSTGMRLAQVAEMLRTRAADGVSTSTWLLLAFSGTAWGAVGAATHEWLLVVGAVLGIITTVLIAAVAARLQPSPTTVSAIR